MNSTNADMYNFVSCYVNSKRHVLAVNFPSSFTVASHFTACILTGIISLTTVFVNMPTVVTFWRAPRLRKNVSAYFIMVLSMADAGIGAFSSPIVTINLAFDLIYKTNCSMKYVQSILFMITSFMSISIISAISIERYFGVVHPLVHRTKVTKDKLLFFLRSIWSIMLVMLVLTAFFPEAFRVFTMSTKLTLMLMIAFVYMKIVLTVIRSKTEQKKLIQLESLGTQNSNNQVTGKHRSHRLHFLKELKTAKSSFLIVFCYVVCNMPAMVKGVMRDTLSNSTLFFASPWCLLFEMLNPILNSFIYFWRNAPLRKEALKVLRNITGK